MTIIDPSKGQMGSEHIIPIPPYMTPIQPQVTKFDVIPYNVIGIIASVMLTVFSIHLIIKWSRKWNENFSNINKI